MARVELTINEQRLRELVREEVEQAIEPLDQRLGQVEEIEEAQLRAEEARNAAWLAAVKALGSGIASACEALGAALANPRVQIGVLAVVLVWLAGRYALQIQYGDLTVGGSVVEGVERTLGIEGTHHDEPQP